MVSACLQMILNRQNRTTLQNYVTYLQYLHKVYRQFGLAQDKIGRDMNYILLILMICNKHILKQ